GGHAAEYRPSLGAPAKIRVTHRAWSKTSTAEANAPAVAGEPRPPRRARLEMEVDRAVGARSLAAIFAAFTLPSLVYPVGRVAVDRERQGDRDHGPRRELDFTKVHVSPPEVRKRPNGASFRTR